jgi:dTDP-4-amino-4,6-dideoxygalactose transaminase
VTTADVLAVPFLDLGAVNEPLRDEYERAFGAVLRHGRFVGGEEIERFEDEFAAYCGATACVGVANGTDALELILTGLGIGPGDEVIVPANTFVATAEAVWAAGARPVFVDVLPDTLQIDAAAAAAAVTGSTAAVMAVHLFGQMADVEALLAVSDRHGLAVIEDAAQAHGARFAGRRAGSVGIAAGFSFYPSKNLGALGDGGAVITSDDGLAERVRALSNHGRGADDRHRHDRRGRNSRLDTLQAAVLSAKLRCLDALNAGRVQAMERYRIALPPGCRPVAVHPAADPVHHLAVVEVNDRQRITRALRDGGIGWGIHYPVPCHRQPAFAAFSGESLPVAERAAERIVSLPMWPTITDAEVWRVCEVLQEALT